MVGELPQQLVVRVVGQRIFAPLRRLARVEVGVDELQVSGAQGIERLPEVLPGGRETLQEQAFGLRRRHGEAEGAKRTDLRNQPVNERQETREPLRLLVIGTKFLLVLL